MKRLLAAITLAGCSLAIAANESNTRGLDYLVGAPTTRSYVLRAGLSSLEDRMQCNLKVLVETEPSDPNNEDGEEVIHLELHYSQFQVLFWNEKMRAEAESVLRAGGIDVFTYEATVNRYGEVLCSDLSDRLDDLERQGTTQKRFVRQLLEPMIGCTWLCVFPRLGPTNGSRLAHRDLRDWSALSGATSVVRNLRGSETADYLNLHFSRSREDNRKVILWLDLSRLEASTKYGAPHDITRKTRVELQYDPKRRAVTRGTAIWMTAEGEEQDTVSFEATLKTK